LNYHCYLISISSFLYRVPSTESLPQDEEWHFVEQPESTEMPDDDVELCEENDDEVCFVFLFVYKRYSESNFKFLFLVFRMH